jgi:hypothetical protein
MLFVYVSECTCVLTDCLLICSEMREPDLSQCDRLKIITYRYDFHYSQRQDRLHEN